MLTIQERIQQAKWALQEAEFQMPPEHADPRVDSLWSAVNKLTLAVEGLARKLAEKGTVDE